MSASVEAWRRLQRTRVKCQDTYEKAVWKAQVVLEPALLAFEASELVARKRRDRALAQAELHYESEMRARK